MTDPGDRLLELYAKAEAQQHTHTKALPTKHRPRRVKVTAVRIPAHEWRKAKAYADAHGIPLTQSRDVQPGRYVLAFTNATGAQRLASELKKHP